MKKLMLIFALLIAVFAVQGQAILVTVVNGSVGVDSLGAGDAQDNYYYAFGTSGTQNSIVSATATKAAASAKITRYYLAAVHLGSVHSLVTANQDSVKLSVEASLDNVNWFHISLNQGVAPILSGTGVLTNYTMLPATEHFTPSTLIGNALYIPTAKTVVYPYYRVKATHMKSTGYVYPKAFFYLVPLL